MKQILILLVAVICFSCSSDDDNNGSIDFHPPTWIQGTWYIEGSSAGVKFTTDDFCDITGGEQTCYKEINEQSDVSITVENEHSTDTTYEFTRVYLGEPGVARQETYRFEQTTPTLMVRYEGEIAKYTYFKQ